MRPTARPGTGAAAPLIELLNSYAALSDSEIALVEDSLGDSHAHGTGAELSFGDGPIERPVLVTHGWAAEAALMEDGRRQIVSLVLPGDVISPLEMRRVGLTAAALTSVRARDAGRLVTVLAQADEVGALVKSWRLTRQAAQARLVRHVVRLGRRSAYDRTADFLLELHERQKRAGLADQRAMTLPLTQEVLADHLGLSIVHVNRTLQQLRRDGLIDYQGGRFLMRDRAHLAAIAGQAA